MDIVYAVGRPALWGHNELRFSIRSAEKHLKFDRLFIVGYKPSFLNSKAIHLMVEDDQGHKYTNVAKKIKFILNYPDISEDFIYMNDDFFLLKDYDPIPYLWNKPLKEWVENYPLHKGKYYDNICKLYKDFPAGKFFETHFPIVFNKTKARKVIDKYGLGLTLMLRSYFANEYESELSPVQESRDYKIQSKSKIDEFPKDAPFASCTNEVAVDSKFKSFLQTKFPNKSSFEG